MSAEYTVYASGSGDAIRRFVGSYLRVEWRAADDGDEGVFLAEWLDIPITMEMVHDMINDVGIVFSQYPVSVMFSRSAAQGDSDLREDLCRLAALLVARQITARMGVRTMVVRNSQRVLEAH